jgi:hypothetical protein
MKVHTLRGRLAGNEIRRLVIDDGRLTHAMRVVSMEVFPVSVGSGNDIQITLSLNRDFSVVFDAANNGQIGWGSWWSDASAKHDWSYIDPNHLVVRELYISNSSAAGAQANYVIKLEAMDISDDESILQLIKENQQGDPID